ncbi:MAG: ribonuclease H [Polyangiaceae bacterium]
MPWVEATLRGQSVLARARADGTLDSVGGRVEIRYGKSGGRAYRAGVGNLVVEPGATVLADDACAPASPAGAISGGRTRAGAAPVSPREPGAWRAYTDGACSGNPGPAGSGVVLVSPDGKIREGFESLGQATNNVAELTAILRALEWIPDSAVAIVVYTDSQYAIGVLQKGWKAKANQDLVATAKRAVAERNARLVYVPGHEGVPLNERADELAREAVRTGGKQVPQ